MGRGASAAEGRCKTDSDSDIPGRLYCESPTSGPSLEDYMRYLGFNPDSDGDLVWVFACFKDSRHDWTEVIKPVKRGEVPPQAGLDWYVCWVENEEESDQHPHLGRFLKMLKAARVAKVVPHWKAIMSFRLGLLITETCREEEGDVASFETPELVYEASVIFGINLTDEPYLGHAMKAILKELGQEAMENRYWMNWPSPLEQHSVHVTFDNESEYVDPEAYRTKIEAYGVPCDKPLMSQRLIDAHGEEPSNWWLLDRVRADARFDRMYADSLPSLESSVPEAVADEVQATRSKESSGDLVRKAIDPQVQAATTIQVLVRGYFARKSYSFKRNKAIKIQARFRGYLVRKYPLGEAIKIQARIRGYLVRRRLREKGWEGLLDPPSSWWERAYDETLDSEDYTQFSSDLDPMPELEPPDIQFPATLITEWQVTWPFLESVMRVRSTIKRYRDLVELREIEAQELHLQELRSPVLSFADAKGVLFYWNVFDRPTSITWDAPIQASNKDMMELLPQESLPPGFL